jgi:hypothetical protein
MRFIHPVYQWIIYFVLVVMAAGVILSAMAYLGFDKFFGKRDNTP